MPVRTHLKEIRASRRISAAQLADQVGLSRQAVHAIESGTFVPNTSVSLLLARALGVRVEELFSLPDEVAEEQLSVNFLDGNEVREGQLVQACDVNGRVMAFPVPLVPTYLPSADGIVSSKKKSMKHLRSLPADGKRLLLAGCDPALSLLSQSLLSSGFEIVSVSCSSRRALEWLKRGVVHAAGSHLLDRGSGNYNLPIISRLFLKEPIRVVTFATWEQGLVVKPGNPKGIRSLADLGEAAIRVRNREKGSGSRDLLDSGLRANGIAVEKVTGYNSVASGHLAAALAVATGDADCCIAPRSAARCFGLGFVPLTVERFDLAFNPESVALPATKALLNELNRSTLKSKLRSFAGYDTSQTGQVLT